MKLILFLTFGLLLLSSCGGSGTSPASIPEGSDLRADVTVKKQPDGTTVEVMFYHSAGSTSGNQNTGSARTYVAVENAMMNEVPMTAATDASGRAVYKADTSKMKTNNVIAASLGGKQYEGTVQVIVMLGDRVVSTMLKPKQP